MLVEKGADVNQVEKVSAFAGLSNIILNPILWEIGGQDRL